MLGALCAYVLIGMAFAFTYRAIGVFQTPAFFGTNGDGTLSQDLFFSFITLTTTGYGNLVPEKNPGQTLAVFEALIGQLFLVTAVGKIVTAWRPPRLERRDHRRAANLLNTRADHGGPGSVVSVPTASTNTMMPTTTNP